MEFGRNIEVETPKFTNIITITIKYGKFYIERGKLMIVFLKQQHSLNPH